MAHETHTRNPTSIGPLRPFAMDGAQLWFDRETGVTVVRRDGGTQELQQQVPRVVQFGLTNACNLHCGFCSRDELAPTTWDADSAFHLLSELADAGVMEVAFGGGEPLLARGFDELVERLYRETRLGVGFTTNGTRLTDERIARLAPATSQVRLSIYDDNDWRETAQRLDAGSACYGANLLVTPEVLPNVTEIALELLSTGCRDLLLLAYTGPDTTLHLSEAGDGELSSGLRGLHQYLNGRMGLSIDVCFGDRLDVPRLVEHGDCRAGVDAIVVTSDRRLLGCSYQEGGVPFDGARELLQLWREGRGPGAGPSPHAGCARQPEHGLGRSRKPGRIRAGSAPRVGYSIWSSFASNNSGAYTILGTFTNDESTQAAATRLTNVCAEHDVWVRATQDSTSAEEPFQDSPLAAFIAAESLSPSSDGDEYEEWPLYGAAPEVVRVGWHVVIHVDYTAGMPRALGEWFYRSGGRVSLELDHTHEPLIIRSTFWIHWNQPNVEERTKTMNAALRQHFPDAEWKPARGNANQSTLAMRFDDIAAGLREMHAVAESVGAKVAPWFEECGMVP